MPAESGNEVPQCDAHDCSSSAEVELINIRTGTGHNYCLDHAEKGVDEFGRYNVGDAL